MSLSTIRKQEPALMLSAGISGRQRGSPPSRPQGRFPFIITKIDRESTAEKWERSQKQKNICCF